MIAATAVTQSLADGVENALPLNRDTSRQRRWAPDAVEQ